MPVITAYTAAKMLAVENSRTIDGDVVGNDLILTRGDLSTTNVGVVRGPAGNMGPTGPGAIGTLAYAERSTEHTGIVGSLVDITGLSISFAAEIGRLYRITVQGHIYSSVSGDIGQVQLTDDANTVWALGQAQMIPSFGKLIYFSWTNIMAAGTHNLKVRAIRGVGTGSMVFSATTQNKSFIHAEDIGIA